MLNHRPLSVDWLLNPSCGLTQVDTAASILLPVFPLTHHIEQGSWAAPSLNKPPGRPWNRQSTKWSSYWFGVYGNRPCFIHPPPIIIAPFNQLSSLFPFTWQDAWWDYHHPAPVDSQIIRITQMLLWTEGVLMVFKGFDHCLNKESIYSD